MTDPHHCDEAADEARRYHWEEVSPDTPQVIVDALGGAGAGRSRPEIEPVRVVRAGVQTPWPTPGTLLFEDGTRQAVAGFLPADLPLGYHEFTPDDGRPKTRLIVTPWRCVVPASRRWGWAVQVYAARSAASWGIGDLADLRRLAKWSARLGAGFLMINPLGAPAPVLPQAASPYYPTSRRFYNPLYLRIEEVPGAEQLGPDLERLAAAGHALNATGRIDRDRVFRLKQEALRAIWAGFRGDPAWDRFRREQGPSLVLFGTYCVLAERFGADWRQWPAEYRRPEDPQVQRFAAQQSDDVAYHQWLQWLLDEQLARAARTLPLVQDLPIGFDPGGADAWQWQDLLAAGVSTGAPPDEFNADGQDWQLPPFVPWKLRAAGYQPLIETLRATLRHAGGLRIDHVMGLFRLWWIPRGEPPRRGWYVRYPADELLAVVTLESQRAGALMVGEDLGTVEPGVRERLRERGILSCRLLWFEPRGPAEYPPLSMASVTTHDLPTIAGLWSGSELAAQAAAGLPLGEEMHKLQRHFHRLLGLAADTPIPDVIEAAYGRLAGAPSLLLTATLEDAQATGQRPNVPGTTDQWPNWSLAMPETLEQMERAELPRRIARALARRATPPLHE